MGTSANTSSYGSDVSPTGRVTWLGHSTVLIELDGMRLLTDPLLRTRVTHLKRSIPLYPRPLGKIDGVLVSHVHYDHLDLPSLELLGRAVRLVVPRGAGGSLRRRRFGNVIEVDAGEEVSIGGLRLRATHAEHDASRGLFRTSTPSLGFVLSGSRAVYFAGDTDLFDGMAELGPLDLALLPIWGWGRSIGPGHLDPRRAAEALVLLRPGAAVPIHWGTYAPIGLGGSAFLTDPPEDFRRAAAVLAPAVDVHVLRVGGSLELSAAAVEAQP